MVKSVLENMVSISSFSRGESSKNFEKAKSGPVYVLKNNAPEAVIVTADEFRRLIEIEEDYILINDALNRLASDSGASISHEEVLKRLMLTQETIDDLEEIELD